MSWIRVARFKVVADLDKDGKPCGPRGQPRVRAYRRGERAGVYTSARAKQWKKQIADAWDDRVVGLTLETSECPIAGPIRLDIVCRFTHPRLHYSGHGKSPNLRGDAPTFQNVRPDTDNLAKVVLDALSVDQDHPRRPWSNDWRVSVLNVVKRYNRRGTSQDATITISEWRDRDE